MGFSDVVVLELSKDTVKSNIIQEDVRNVEILTCRNPPPPKILRRKQRLRHTPPPLP